MKPFEYFFCLLLRTQKTRLREYVFEYESLDHSLFFFLDSAFRNLLSVAECSEILCFRQKGVYGQELRNVGWRRVKKVLTKLTVCS